MARKYLAGIKEILKCDVCLDDIKKPMMLVCYHSFCEKCLDTMDINTGFGKTNKVTCPKCRKKTNIPWAGASRLPSHWKLSELAELFSQPEEVPVCVACPGWTDKNKPEYYCHDCKDYLCEPCKEAHMDTPMFEEHEIATLCEQEFNRAYCPDHPYKFKDYYCKDCKVLVCSACVTAHHKDHTVSNFEEYDEVCRTELESQKTKLTEKFHLPIKFKPNLCYHRIPNESMKNGLEKTKEAMQAKIRRASLSVIKDVELKRDELLKQLDENHAMLNKTLSADVFKKECETVLNHKSPGYLVDEYQKLSEKLESLLHGEEDGEEMPDWSDESPIVYSSFTPGKAPISIGSFGKSTVNDFREKRHSMTYTLKGLYYMALEVPDE